MGVNALGWPETINLMHSKARVGVEAVKLTGVDESGGLRAVKLTAEGQCVGGQGIKLTGRAVFGHGERGRFTGTGDKRRMGESRRCRNERSRALPR